MAGVRGEEAGALFLLLDKAGFFHGINLSINRTIKLSLWYISFSRLFELWSKVAYTV